jgi:uncharacterized protein
VTEPSAAEDHAAPARSRIVALDALRGFAVLGIFMMNIQTFAMVVDAYGDPLAHMDFSGANRLVWIVSHLFFDLKFITIFSVLFGAGVAMTAGSGRDGATARHVRRMAILFAIGVLHAYLFWYGDILMAYAVWGMACLLFLDRRAGALIAGGVALVGVTAFLFWAQYDGWVQSSYFSPSLWRPSAEDIARAEALYRAPWPERVVRSAAETTATQTGSGVFFGPRVLGCMLIGIGLYRLGFLTGAWSAGRYAVCALAGLAVGLGLSAVTTWGLMAGEFLPRAMRWAAPLDHMAALVVAFFYASIVMLAAKPQALRWLVSPLAAVGRMALTNYIAQSVIAASLFYGPPGLSWFGTVERTGQFGIVLAVWAAQLIWSPLWLSAFRFGPLEWVWRSLTYCQAQPMLRRPAPA